MDELKFKNQKELLERIIKSWEKLGEGSYSVKTIQYWLLNDMKPSIDLIREHLKNDLENEI